MKRLFLFVVMALSFGVFALTSCDKDKEKNELKEEIEKNNGGRPDTLNSDTIAASTKFLPVSQQQAIFSQTVGGLSQAIDFSDIARKMGLLFQETGYDIKWGDFIDALCAQDEILQGKLNVLREITEHEEIALDFEDLYFAADIKLIDSIIVDSTAYNQAIFWALNLGHPEEHLDSSSFDGYLIKDTVKFPVLMNIQHETDRFKVNFHIGENIVAISLKCQGNSDGSVSIESVFPDSVKNRYIGLPEIAELSLSINGDTVISLNAGLNTDFNVQASRALDPDDKGFKLRSLIFDGSGLDLNASAKLDNYSLWAKANYDVENGLKVGFAANMYNNEVISGDITVNGVISKATNWTDPITILAWAANNNSFKGVDCNLKVNTDLIRMHLSLDNPLVNPDVLELFTLLAFATEQTPAPTDERMNQMVATINELLKGEIYFKGFEDPQAVLKIVYSPSTKGGIGDVLKAVPANFERFGLQLGFETYDAEGQKTFVTVKEYFAGIDFKAAGKQIVNKFTEAFGPVISTMFHKEDVSYIVVENPYLDLDSYLEKGKLEIE